MNIIACYNIKGGVGKTATAVNLAFLAAQKGGKVLLWDLDPQGASSFYYRTEPKQQSGRAANMLRQKSTLASFIESTSYPGIDIIPADYSIRNIDLLLSTSRHSERRLSKLLSNLMGQYDYIFLDCPPTTSLLSDNIFHSSDILLVPTIPTTLSLRTLRQIISIQADTENAPRLITFFTLVDRRKTMHRLVVDRPPNLNANILGTSIPYSADIERMGNERCPLHVFASSSHPAKAYEALWLELKAEIYQRQRAQETERYELEDSLEPIF